MPEPRIALILDHPQRDLAGITLTAVELCQRGAICYLVPVNLEEKEIWSLAPDFVLLNFFRRGNEKFGRALVRAGIEFGLLDTEGGVWAEPESYAELLWEDRALLRAAGCACIWGPVLARYLIDQGLLAEEQIAVTGCPRFDFYSHAWRGVLLDEVVADEKNTGRILINTNFSLGNPRFATAESNIKYCRDVFGWSEEKTLGIVRAEARAIDTVLAMARMLANDFPESKVILRPHPFEKLERYYNGAAGVGNVEIDTGGPVQPQIFRADVVIQRSCSTAIEAAMAGKPTLSPQWVPVPILVPSSEAVSDPCGTYDELKCRVAAILSGEYVTPPAVRQAVDRVIHDWFYRADGAAHERVRDVVLRSVDRGSPVSPKQCSKYLYGIDRGNWDRTHISGLLRYGLGLSPDWSFRYMRHVPPTMWNRKDKYFGAAEVSKLVQRIQEIKRSLGCEVRPVSVAFARDCREYSHDYYGHSVRLACEE